MDHARDLEALRLAGIDDVDALVHAAAQFVQAHVRADPVATAPLSAEERTLLLESGALGLDDPAGSPMQAGPVDVVGQYAQLVAGSRSTDAVAGGLGVVPSRVRQRITERSLYAIDTAEGRAFPAFQFDASGAALPGLGRVLAAIDPSVHAITVERFFLCPAPDLDSTLAGRALSPREWLLSGMPIDEVVLPAREL